MTTALIVWAEHVRWRLELNAAHPAVPRWKRTALFDAQYIGYRISGDTLLASDGREIKLGARWIPANTHRNPLGNIAGIAETK